MKRQAEALIPTECGVFRMLAYASSPTEKMPHIALLHEKTDLTKPIIVRIHSECMTGDIFGSRKCDCGEQLDSALKTISQDGGLLIYLRQEGRGIGLINKLKAYNLQAKGLDTAAANIHLGFEIDERNYSDALFILKDLDIQEIKLLTNNPLKISALEESSTLKIVERLPLIIAAKKENEQYFETKKKLMGHLF